MKMATAMKLAIADEETHLLSRIKEEEFILEMLHEEVELTSSRKKTAIHQLDSICQGMEYFGVGLPDDKELEAAIRQAPPEMPQSPRTPTMTPPKQIYQELLTDILSHATTSSSFTGGSSNSSSFSLIPPIHPPSPKVHLPTLGASAALSQQSFCLKYPPHHLLFLHWVNLSQVILLEMGSSRILGCWIVISYMSFVICRTTFFVSQQTILDNFIVVYMSIHKCWGSQLMMYEC